MTHTPTQPDTDTEPIPYVVTYRYRYAVNIREWFDKTWGNTYMSVRIRDLLTGQEWCEPFQYGNGHGMGERAASALMCEPITRDNAVWDYCTVTRRKDLHNGGRK